MIGAAVRRALRPLDPRSRAQVERDIEDEFAFHLAMLERDAREEGLSGEAARAEGERRFGDVEGWRQRCLAPAMWEKAMLQKFNLILLLVIAVFLGFFVLIQQRQAVAARLEAMRAREMQLEASAAADRAREDAKRMRAVVDQQRTGESVGLVYIEGLVQRPGTYNISPGMTLRRAITTAGSFNRNVSRVQVVNDDGTGKQAVRFTLDAKDFVNVAGPDVELKANDLIRVE